MDPAKGKFALRNTGNPNGLAHLDMVYDIGYGMIKIIQVYKGFLIPFSALAIFPMDFHASRKGQSRNAEHWKC